MSSAASQMEPKPSKLWSRPALILMIAFLWIVKWCIFLPLFSHTLSLTPRLQPVMSGLDATREIRRREALQAIPAQYIIALTANARPEQIKLCITAGMDDVMVRGIDSRSNGAD